MPYSRKEITRVLDAVRKYGSRPAVIAQAVNLNPRQVEGIKRRNYDEWRSAVTEFALFRKKTPELSQNSTPIETQSLKDAGESIPLPPPRDPVDVEQERQTRLRALKEERDILKDIAGERSLRTKLEGLFRDVVPVFEAPPRRPLPNKLTKDTTKETFLLVLSDLHGFEIVNAESTRGLNAYNGLIMCQRARKVIDTVISIKTKMEKGGGWSFPRLVIALNGDLVSGTIHELERHTDAKNIITATYGVGLLVASMVQDLAEVFPEIDIYCVSGNHGRLPDARKMQSKDPMRNFDTMVALLAKEITRNLSHVNWHIPNAYAVAYEVEGWTVLQQHGDNVPPGALSIPLYGIDRQVRNINALEAQRGNQVQYFVYSHFHNVSMTGHAGAEAVVNGSLIGGTEWTINRLGKCDRPMQMLVAFHEDHGMTHRWPIQADTPSDAPAYELPGLWELGSP